MPGELEMMSSTSSFAGVILCSAGHRRLLQWSAGSSTRARASLARKVGGHLRRFLLTQRQL